MERRSVYTVYTLAGTVTSNSLSTGSIASTGNIISGAALATARNWGVYLSGLTGGRRISGQSFGGVVIEATPFSTITLRDSGNVGIGTNNPSYRLEVPVNSAAKPTSNVWTISSDERIKTDIKDFTDGLSTVLRIKPRTYKYNGRAGAGYNDTNAHIGIIAQDLEPVAPYMVGQFKGTLDGKETILKNYDGQALPFILVNAIKELKAENDLLKAELNNLKIHTAHTAYRTRSQIA